jgi:hypothetical protein
VVFQGLIGGGVQLWTTVALRHARHQVSKD